MSGTPILYAELRARIIADVAGNANFIGKPEARREAIEKAATLQIRAAIEQDRNARDTLGGTHA